MLNIICALAANRAIGRDNKLIYHLPADLRRFKALTTGHTVIMGRRTFESLPKGALPDRRNIVLSRQTGYQAPSAEAFTSLEAALAACDTVNEEVFIIGGGSVYAEALPLADRLYLTHIEALPEGADAFFPKTDDSVWRLVYTEPHAADEKNANDFTFADYERL